ncbi:hypothetical protein ANCDUO_11336 [Ancylostoma duodenale]|uniref:Integrase zinc-binding domain-containing protein n=1 Tax=Ancylostoma duodenale TaxID=51022 RepID=A0A0C2CP23_9BILA|nr:hypothetical protein ANCDUO_11336 [Ancylostoma duodenale]
MAKSKVSDIKRQTTIPKLELNAITIGARLCLNVLLSLKSSIHIDNVFIFTDSEIALNWIAAPLHRNNSLGVFITNRIKEVHKIVKNFEASIVSVQFGYINTTRNPADCGTRGLARDDLEAHIWWTGYNLEQIKNTEIIRNLFSIPEEEDIKDAQYVLIRNHQAVHINHQCRKELTKNLNLKEDEENVPRAYGRLNKSDLDAAAKNPILIVPNTELCRLLIIEAHGLYHNGTAHTMSQIRQMYWIPKLREQVKKHVRSCIPCQKMNNLAYKYPEMTDLPKVRVTKAQPFQHIGLDYFGPLTVFREDMVKTTAYGCIFTCTVTRMIHL